MIWVSFLQFLEVTFFHRLKTKRIELINNKVNFLRVVKRKNALQFMLLLHNHKISCKVPLKDNNCKAKRVAHHNAQVGILEFFRNIVLLKNKEN